MLDHTHDPKRSSWLGSANEAGADFPVQNLPFGVFRRKGTSAAFSCGVAIGDQILDLAALARTGLLSGAAHEAASAGAAPCLNDLMAKGPKAWKALRHGLFALLESTAAAQTQDQVRARLVPQAEAEMALPTRIGDYTDFYTSIDHARNVGRFARPDNPLTPNFQWLPIAYHGRASSIGVTGQAFHRPKGQSMPPGASKPVYGPCARLDYELELAIYIGTGNSLGHPIPVAEAEQHIFGVGLLNDWSARDHQFWEMAPLGPFLGKNFATTISPWVVTLDALAPFRMPWTRPDDHPQPLPYLDAPGIREAGAFDIQLEVLIDTKQSRQGGQSPMRLSRTSFRHQYWTIGQMVAQHTVNGCNLATGDLFGSGTISGPTPEEGGAIIELALGGTKPIKLANGEERAFLQDGDGITLRGWCEKPGAVRIGLGISRGEVLPAL